MAYRRFCYLSPVLAAMYHNIYGAYAPQLFIFSHVQITQTLSQEPSRFNQTTITMSYKSTIIITGGTAGLGYQAALIIAKSKPDHLIILSSRTDKDGAAESINTSLSQTNTIFLPLDLSDLDNIHTYANNFSTANYPPISALLLNAGLQFPGPLSTIPSTGLESTFAINHVGHVLLFHLLVPYFSSTETTRVIVTSSGTHDPAQKTAMPDAVYNSAEELAHPTSPVAVNRSGRQRYCTSKLCNVLWTYALHSRLAQYPEKKIAVNAFDPGFMPGTGLTREATAIQKFIVHRVLRPLVPLLRIVFIPNTHTAEESGRALARLAVERDLEGVSGKYYEGEKAIQTSVDSYDVRKQDDLWDWTLRFLSGGDEGIKKKWERFE